MKMQKHTVKLHVTTQNVFIKKINVINGTLKTIHGEHVKIL